MPIANYFDEISPCTEAGISLLEGNNADAAELKRRLGIQILVLANPTDVSRARTQHLYDSLSPELKCITSVVPGILYKDYSTVKDMILFDKPELVSLSDESRQAAWTRFTVNTIMHWGQFFSYGFFCCNVAHLAAWDRAAGFSGITVVLEDDSVLLDKSLTVNQLLERILEDQINGTGRPALAKADDDDDVEVKGAELYIPGFDLARASPLLAQLWRDCLCCHSELCKENVQRLRLEG